MDFTFKHLANAESFLRILPKDWQDVIVPFWKKYKSNSEVYVIEVDYQIIGGGIVFSTPPPDIEYYKDEAKEWFEKGYLYIGFLWIDENRRNHNLGSFWLDELKMKYPQQPFWLLIEEPRLHRFYQKNGFALIKTIEHTQNPEWLYSFEPLLR